MVNMEFLALHVKYQHIPKKDCVLCMVYIEKYFVLYGVIYWEGMSVMSCFFCSSQEPQIKAGMQWPVIEGTRKHYLVCSLTQFEI